MKQSLPLKVKLGYGVGDLGTNMVIQAVNLQIMFFMTDVFGIDPIIAGTIVLIANLWDAVWDTIVGFMVDRSRSKMGQKRPFLLIGAIPYGLSFAMLYFGPDIGSDTGKIIWMFVAFILFRTTMSFVNVPYASLTVSLTDDAVERTKLTSFRMTFAIVGLLIAGLFQMFTGMFGGGLEGYRIIGIIFAVVVIISTLIPFFAVKEKQPDTAHSGKIRDNIKAVGKNPPFLILSFATLFFMITTNLIASMVNYYFKYTLMAEDKSFIGLAALFVSALIYVFPLGILANKFGKRVIYQVSMIILALSLVALGLFVHDATGAIIVFLFSGIGISAIFLMPWSIVADTIEYSEWKTGVRPEGALYGFFLLMQKIAAAIAISLQGWVLGASGYISPVKGSALAQPESAQSAIVFLTTFFPAIFLAIGVIILFAYKIGNAEHAELKRQIALKGQKS